MLAYDSVYVLVWLSMPLSRFKTIFACLDDLDFEIKADGERPRTLLKDHFLLAVHSPDATVVYYNIARGLVKPIN